MRRKAKNFGFTMPEILISFSLFTIVVAAATGILLTSFRSQRSAIAFLHAQNNLRFVLESMSREMRTGIGFQIIPPAGPALRNGLGVAESGDILAFQSQQGANVRYRVVDGRLEKSTDGGTSYSPLTAENVTVESLKFYLSGAAEGDSAQARLTLSLKVRTQSAAQEAEILVQTSVTQRELDN